MGITILGFKAKSELTRKYIIVSNREEKELIPALRAAPDAAALVLDALDGFYSDEMKNNGKDGEILAIRRTCINLLQRVQELGPEIKQPIKEKAKKVAVQWKAKVSDDGDDLEAHGFLQLLVAYKLVDEFKVDEVLDVVVLVARRKQTIELCKVLGVEMHIPGKCQRIALWLLFSLLLHSVYSIKEDLLLFLVVMNSCPSLLLLDGACKIYWERLIVIKWMLFVVHKIEHLCFLATTIACWLCL